MTTLGGKMLRATERGFEYSLSSPVCTFLPVPEAFLHYYS